MKRTYKYRLFTNNTQESKLSEMFNLARYLYNCALEHRILCYKTHKKSISYYDQANSLKEIRLLDERFIFLNFSCTQDILRRLDKTFKAFFRRIKLGQTPGFPRFKGLDRFHSITFPVYGDGIKFKGNKLYIQNIGLVRINLHRNLVGKIKTVTIKKSANRFYACFSCDEIPNNLLPISDKQIGIDVGIKTFAVYSDGTEIENPKYLKQSEEKLKLIQQKHSKKKTKTTKKKLTNLHLKISNQRRDFQHKLSHDIIKKFGFIYTEKLNIVNMLKSDSSNLNKYISDAAWSQFTSMIRYKAESAGRIHIEVDPKNTSQSCSACGQIVKKNLSKRMHICSCGFTDTRDHNAALNILALGQSVCVKQEAVSFS